MVNESKKYLFGCLVMIGILSVSTDVIYGCSIAEEAMPFVKKMGETIALLGYISSGLYLASFILFVFNIIYKRSRILSSICFIVGFASIPLFFSYYYTTFRQGFCGYENEYNFLIYVVIFISIVFIFQLGLSLNPFIKRKML